MALYSENPENFSPTQLDSKKADVVLFVSLEHENVKQSRGNNKIIFFIELVKLLRALKQKTRKYLRQLRFFVNQDYPLFDEFPDIKKEKF